jgi:hypothetical protein
VAGGAVIASLPRGQARVQPRIRALRALAVGCGYALAARGLLLLVTLATLPLPPAGQLARGHFNLWSQWSDWDGRWYAAIATGGYRPDLRRFAFFPLLPLLEAWLRGYLGGSAAAAGVAVSLAASCAAFTLLYQRVSEWSDEATAERAVRYLALFPTGFFLAVAYTESLFLALALACMRALDRRRWLAAGVTGALAALTRNAGVLLALPAAWAVLQSRESLRRWWPVVLIPGALLGFMAYQGAVAHDLLAFVHVQAVWRRHVAWPWTTAALLWHALWHAPDAAGNLANLASALLAAFTLWLGRRWIPVADQIVAWALWAISAAAPAQPPALVLLSMDRFVIVIYPLFAELGRWGRRPALDRALMLAMPVAQAALFTLFIHGYFVG